MNNNPTTAASLELVKALEELTKTTGVRIDLLPLETTPKQRCLRLIPDADNGGASVADMDQIGARLALEDDDGA